MCWIRYDFGMKICSSEIIIRFTQLLQTRCDKASKTATSWWISSSGSIPSGLQVACVFYVFHTTSESYDLLCYVCSAPSSALGTWECAYKENIERERKESERGGQSEHVKIMWSAIMNAIYMLLHGSAVLCTPARSVGAFALNQSREAQADDDASTVHFMWM